jgi:uncharacterized protein YkwD
MNTQLVESIVQVIYTLSPEEQALVRQKLADPTSQEAILLQKITQGSLSADTQQRYNKLRAKLQSDTLTSEEHAELLALVDVVEQADAERLQHLIALSKLRNVTLPELMQQLNLQAPPVYV